MYLELILAIIAGGMISAIAIVLLACLLLEYKILTKENEKRILRTASLSHGLESLIRQQPGHLPY